MASDNFGELPDATRTQLSFQELFPSPTQFVLAATVEDAAKWRTGSSISIATSYPRLACAALGRLGYAVRDMFVIDGAVEAAAGLVDGIVDITMSGETLRANNLVAVEQNIWPVCVGAVTRQALA